MITTSSVGALTYPIALRIQIIKKITIATIIGVGNILNPFPNYEYKTPPVFPGTLTIIV
jgi:hypothetical protein